MTRSAQFSVILNEMKRDYQDMYDQLDNPKIFVGLDAELLVEKCESVIPVKSVVVEQIRGIRGNGSDIPNISMAIQKGKYDGTQESFDKWTGQTENK